MLSAHSPVTFIPVILIETVPGFVLAVGTTKSSVSAGQHWVCRAMAAFPSDPDNGRDIERAEEWALPNPLGGGWRSGEDMPLKLSFEEGVRTR